MKAEAAEIADRAERRGPFSRAMMPCAASSTIARPWRRAIASDRVHFAGHAGVVHRHDRPGARRDRGLDQPFVEIERVLPDVDEHRDRAAQHERIRRRHEGEGRHDHFVAALDVEQQRRHVERRGAGMRQQRLGAAGSLLDPLMAAFRERAVAGKVGVAMRFGQIVEFLARRVRAVEWNKIGCHCYSYAGLADDLEHPDRDAAKLAVSVAEINGPSERFEATKLFLCAGWLSTSFRRADSPLDMPMRSPALIEEPVDARGKNEDQARYSGPEPGA